MKPQERYFVVFGSATLHNFCSFDSVDVQECVLVLWAFALSKRGFRCSSVKISWISKFWETKKRENASRQQVSEEPHAGREWSVFVYDSAQCSTHLWKLDIYINISEREMILIFLRITVYDSAVSASCLVKTTPTRTPARSEVVCAKPFIMFDDGTNQRL